MIKDFLTFYNTNSVLTIAYIVASLVFIACTIYRHKHLQRFNGKYYSIALEVLLLTSIVILGMFYIRTNNIETNSILGTILFKLDPFAFITMYVIDYMLIPVHYFPSANTEYNNTLLIKAMHKMKLLYITVVIYIMELFLSSFFDADYSQKYAFLSVISNAIFFVPISIMFIAGYLKEFRGFNIAKIKPYFKLLTVAFFVSSAFMLYVVCLVQLDGGSSIKDVIILFCQVFVVLVVHYFLYSYALFKLSIRDFLKDMIECSPYKCKTACQNNINIEI